MAIKNPLVGTVASEKVVYAPFVSNPTNSLSGNGAQTTLTSVTSDARGNIYAAFFYLPSGINIAYISKTSTSGVLLWQKEIDYSSTSTNVYGPKVAYDSAGFLYASILTYNSSSGYSTEIIKCDLEGNIVWGRKITSAAAFVEAIAVDSASNLYLTGNLLSNDSAFLIKYNSSGTLQWQRKMSISTFFVKAYSLAIDSSNNIVVSGQYSTSSTTPSFVIKYNSSGTLQWQRGFTGPTSATNNLNYAGVDSSGNVYLSGIYNGPSSLNQAYVAKYNSAGTLQWQRFLVDSANLLSSSSAFVSDLNGNCYLTAYNAYYSVLAKYNSAGTIQWQRKITYDGGSGQIIFYAISVDKVGNILVGGNNSTASYNYFAGWLYKLLPDGSHTGTYTVNGITNIYQASTFTDSAGSLTSITTTITDAAGTIAETSNTTTFSSGNNLIPLVYI